MSTSSKHWQGTQGYRKLLFLEHVDGQNSKNNYLDNKVPTSIWWWYPSCIFFFTIGNKVSRSFWLHMQWCKEWPVPLLRFQRTVRTTGELIGELKQTRDGKLRALTFHKMFWLMGYHKIYGIPLVKTWLRHLFNFRSSSGGI